MKKFVLSYFLGIVLLMFWGGVYGCTDESGQAVTLEPGKVYNKVICLDIPGQSYTLYLPSNYSPEKKWPIIYAFDPGARGPLPVGLYKTAAEKYGYIVVGSNNARNGPWDPIVKAAHSVWQDSQKRFSINNDRIYATGFSGGARVASIMRYITKRPSAGIIACGAGLSSNIKPKMIIPTRYIGLVGLEDFNLREMKQLDLTFDKVGVEHQILIFAGTHLWPGQDICTQAVEWMEVNAIKQGLREKDEALVKKIFQYNLDNAQKLEQAGEIYFAVNRYEAILQLFNGLMDTTELEGKTRNIKESKEYKAFKKGEEKRSRKESEFINLFLRVTTRLKNTQPLPLVKMVLRELQIRTLENEANKTGKSVDKYDRALARRLLFQLHNHTRQEGNNYFQKGDYQRSILFFEIAVRADSESPFTFLTIYNLACAYAKVKKKSKALKFLKLAIEKGFVNIDYIKNDVDLDYIKKEKEFQSIIQIQHKQ